MPTSVERLGNEPIYIIHYSGLIDHTAVEEAGQKLQSMWDESLPHLALIYDTDPAQIDFQETLKVIQQVSINVTADEGAQTVLLAFAGTTPMIKLFIDALRQRQFGGQSYPLFATLDDAITAMRITLAKLAEHRPTELT